MTSGGEKASNAMHSSLLLSPGLGRVPWLCAGSAEFFEGVFAGDILRDGKLVKLDKRVIAELELEVLLVPILSITRACSQPFTTLFHCSCLTLTNHFLKILSQYHQAKIMN